MGVAFIRHFFGGVLWDVQDTALADIERIEIIRGPGGAVWGTNAVNGVINIITKKTSKTIGNTYTAGTGTYEKSFTTARHGGTFGEHSRYRMYAKQHRRDHLTYQDNSSAGDKWEHRQAGFRIDSELSADQQISFQGDTYKANAAGVAYIPPISLPLPDTIPTSINRSKVSGDNLILRWQHQGEDQAVQSLRLSYDHTYIESILLTEDRTTLDAEYQQSFSWSDQHTTLGVGYRKTRDSIPTSLLMLSSPRSADETWNAFIQNRSSNIAENLDLIMGLKLENNDRMQSDYELQPSIRLNYLFNDSTTGWAALSKAIRSPTRSEQDATLAIFFPANTTIIGLGQTLADPLVVTLSPTGMYDVEEMVSLEAGIRSSVSENIRLDIAAYINQYNGLPGFVINGPLTFNPGPPQQYELNASLINSTDFKIHGFEASVWWRASRRWQGRINYSYASISDNIAFVSVPTVEQQLNINLYGSVTEQVSINIDMRYVGAPAGLIMGEYTEMDIKAIWHLSPTLDISFAGRNLLNDKHLEYSASSATVRNTRIERDFYLSIDWSL